MAARVKAASEAYMVNSIALLFGIDAMARAAVYFSASAAIYGGVSVTYSQDMYAVVLSNGKTKNDTSTWLLGIFAPWRLGLGVYVVGLYGDLSVS